MKKKRILVAGGAGFLGSFLCSRLVSDGHDVICLDNFYTGTKQNIAGLREYPNFEFIRHDICLPVYLEVDEIYNLACPASPVHYQRDPVQTVKTSVLGSVNLLGLAKRTGARILQASTSEVYGDPEVHPQNEEYTGAVNPIGKRACYDEGKRCAETLFFDYQRQHGVDIRVVRIFNTYGPRMALDDGRVISNFVVQALTNRPITIYGDGSQTRSFCYVSDLIEGMISVMRGSSSGPFNIGNPVENTMLDLVSVLSKITKTKLDVIHGELPEGDPKRRKPDITKIYNELGWNPHVNLEDGLRFTVDYFKSVLR